MPLTHYFIKLTPSRSSFPSDITPEEMKIMEEHSKHWKTWRDKGLLLVYGPVIRPDGGGFGIGVAEVENVEMIKEFIANDPAAKAGIGTLEFYPMRAILPDGK